MAIDCQASCSAELLGTIELAAGAASCGNYFWLQLPNCSSLEDYKALGHLLFSCCYHLMDREVGPQISLEVRF